MSARHGGLRVAIVGAAGLVGDTLARVLTERHFPIASLRAFGTARSVGQRLRAAGCNAMVESLDDAREPFSEIDVAFFAAGDEVSRKYADAAAEAGAFVVDKSTVHRLDPKTPLVVPEVNGDAIGSARLVANPNCSTIPLAVALAPIDRAFGLATLNITALQSVSGAGKDALAEYDAQLGGDDTVSALPRRIAGNMIPQNGDFDQSGDGDEERKIAAEFCKILSRPDLPVSVTCVRVPVSVGHSATVAFATRRAATRETLGDVLKNAHGVRFYEGSSYATPLDAVGNDLVHVGRLRADSSRPGGHLAWITCDNLRKGAATNAVQIVEYARPDAKVPA